MKKVIYIEPSIAESLAFTVNVILTNAVCKSELCGALRRSDMANIGSIPIVCDAMNLSRIGVERSLRRRKISVRALPVSRGATVGRGFLANDVPVYLYDSWPQGWGAATLLYTGNLFFTRLMQKHAASLEYKLNGYGLWFGDDQIAGKDEKQIFFALGVSYVPPRYRNFKKGDRLPIII